MFYVDVLVVLIIKTAILNHAYYLLLNFKMWNQVLKIAKNTLFVAVKMLII